MYKAIQVPAFHSLRLLLVLVCLFSRSGKLLHATVNFHESENTNVKKKTEKECQI